LAAIAALGVAILTALPKPSVGSSVQAPSMDNSHPLSEDSQRSQHIGNAGAALLSSPQIDFVGRREDLAAVIKAVKNPHVPIIVIKGMGGIGKTALAHEVARRLLEDKTIARTVWRSTQAEKFIGEGIVRTEIADYSFDALLTDILSQSDMLPTAGAPVAVKLQAVAQWLAASPTLIVLDNLETVSNRDTLVASLFDILGKGKLLVTSRYALSHEQVFTIDLQGLSAADSTRFLRSTAMRQNNPNLIAASPAILTRIYDVSGGAPLAMMLVAGQMFYQPVEQVLKVLENAGFNHLSYEFYSFIFQKCWNELDGAARRILVAMRHFEGSPTAEALRYTVDMKDDAFYSAATTLVRRSLLSVSMEHQQARYSMHPLTKYFLNTDIAASWDRS